MKISWKRALKVWWSLYWRTDVFGILAGFFAGGMAGAAGVLLGNPSAGVHYAPIVAFFVYLPISMLCMKLTLGKHADSLAAEVAAQSIE